MQWVEDPRVKWEHICVTCHLPVEKILKKTWVTWVEKKLLTRMSSSKRKLYLAAYTLKWL